MSYSSIPIKMSSWSRTSVEMVFFFQAIARTVGFVHVIPKKWSRDDRVMSDWCLLTFALSNKMQSKICCREEFDRCKIHDMDKTCLELGTFDEFATAVLQTVAIRAKRCLSSRVTFLNHVNKTNGAWNSLKKPFNKRTNKNWNNETYVTAKFCQSYHVWLYRISAARSTGLVTLSDRNATSIQTPNFCRVESNTC